VRRREVFLVLTGAPRSLGEAQARGNGTVETMPGDITEKPVVERATGRSTPDLLCSMRRPGAAHGPIH